MDPARRKSRVLTFNVTPNLCEVMQVCVKLSGVSQGEFLRQALEAAVGRTLSVALKGIGDVAPDLRGLEDASRYTMRDRDGRLR